MQQTMFHRYGGIGPVSDLIFDFYDRVLAAERLRPYFRDSDMRRLMEHQAKYLSTVMGGPASYSDEQLRTIHAHLGIDRQAFDEMVGHLRAAMEEKGFLQADVEAVVRRYSGLRRAIVTR